MQKRRSRTESPRDSSFDVRSPIRITSPKPSHRYAATVAAPRKFPDSSYSEVKPRPQGLSVGSPCERGNTWIILGPEMVCRRYYMERQTGLLQPYAEFSRMLA